MELLQLPEDRGYPVEYLLSRIRGRRSRLIRDWKTLLFGTEPRDYLLSPRYEGFVKDHSPEGIWRDLVREYRWVCSQMNEELRKIFRPFFLYSELRTLFICLRRVKDQKAERANDLLEVSLLSAAIKKILSTSSDIRSAVERMEPVLPSFSERFDGLTEAFETEGLRGVEQFITNSCLRAITGAALHPVMRMFFSRLIDARNIIAVYKYLSFGKRMSLPLIPGGSLPDSLLRSVVDKDELFGASSLVRRFSGGKINSIDPTKIEIALYRSLTDFLKKEGRDPLGAGLILDYLWRCSVEVMNLSLLFHSADLDRDTASTELVE